MVDGILHFILHMEKQTWRSLEYSRSKSYEGKVK